jgi:hypothetical protein
MTRDIGTMRVSFLAFVFLVPLASACGQVQPANNKIAADAAAKKDLAARRVRGATVELFNGRDLTGWTAYQGSDRLPPGSNLVVEKGELRSPASAKGRLTTDQAFENFSLRLEYRFPIGGTIADNFSSGIGIGTGLQVEGLTESGMIGFQLKPGSAGNIKVAPFKQSAVLPHRRAAERSIGDWNEIEIRFTGADLTVTLNGEPVNQARVLNPGPGRIHFLAWGSDVSYRNIRVITSAPTPALALDHASTPSKKSPRKTSDGPKAAHAAGSQQAVPPGAAPGPVTPTSPDPERRDYRILGQILTQSYQLDGEKFTPRSAPKPPAPSLVPRFATPDYDADRPTLQALLRSPSGDIREAAGLVLDQNKLTAEYRASAAKDSGAYHKAVRGRIEGELKDMIRDGILGPDDDNASNSMGFAGGMSGDAKEALAKANDDYAAFIGLDKKIRARVQAIAARLAGPAVDAAGRLSVGLKQGEGVNRTRVGPVLVNKGPDLTDCTVVVRFRYFPPSANEQLHEKAAAGLNELVPRLLGASEEDTRKLVEMAEEGRRFRESQRQPVDMYYFIPRWPQGSSLRTADVQARAVVNLVDSMDMVVCANELNTTFDTHQAFEKLREAARQQRAAGGLATARNPRTPQMPNQQPLPFSGQRPNAPARGGSDRSVTRPGNPAEAKDGAQSNAPPLQEAFDEDFRNVQAAKLPEGWSSPTRNIAVKTARGAPGLQLIPPDQEGMITVPRVDLAGDFQVECEFSVATENGFVGIELDGNAGDKLILDFFADGTVGTGTEGHIRHRTGITLRPGETHHLTFSRRDTRYHVEINDVPITLPRLNVRSAQFSALRLVLGVTRARGQQTGPPRRGSGTTKSGTPSVASPRITHVRVLAPSP